MSKRPQDARGDRMQNANLHTANSPDSPEYPVNRQSVGAGLKVVQKQGRTPKK